MDNSTPSLIIEVCVDSVQSAVNAIAGGATRLELCGNLGVGGGTTPSLGLLKAVQKVADAVPIMAMVRPRTGDFLYSPDELDVMLQDIRVFKEHRVAGVVLGVLQADGRVAIAATRQLVAEAAPLQGKSGLLSFWFALRLGVVCFHRAFDMARDPIEALEDVASVGGITRILTSGNRPTAPRGLETLKALCRHEREHWHAVRSGGLSIMPGSGLNAQTAGVVLDALLPLGIVEIHLSGGGFVPSAMEFRPEDSEGMGMGGWEVWVTSQDKVAGVRRLLASRGMIAGRVGVRSALFSVPYDREIFCHPPTMAPTAATTKRASPQLWWSNAIFFVGVHVAAIYGALFWRPYYAVPRATLILAFAIWQLADFGLPVRLILAALGSAGFQGSIKWWCLRHRLHHRFTDDPVHDPYAATRGLLWSHMGWIFFKPNYERMELVDRDDLDSDPVVRFQHKYYVPLALFFGFVLPTLLGALWDDATGAYVWGGLVARLFCWHCTFLVNSLAHWDGLQPYSDEDTSRGNFILALLTGGEGSHNFHSFPHDWRSGPHILNWDPSKWIIAILHRLGLVYGLRSVREQDMREALHYMHHKEKHGVPPEDNDEPVKQSWTIERAKEYLCSQQGRCVVVIEDYFVDVTSYLGEHPGGAALLRRYALRADQELKDASWAFDGGLNNHSRSARRRMKEFRVAKFAMD
uniref:Copper homeostasis protein cutC homolog n=1 Tax=Mycena chlorophos TaxID=658473 RepID=A0ABQ0M252_MYCCL|nr:stearoyl-CoA desaturase [Mycena chlorophos]